MKTDSRSCSFGYYILFMYRVTTRRSSAVEKIQKGSALLFRGNVWDFVGVLVLGVGDLIQIKYKIRILSNSSRMNNPSLTSFNKINQEMERLSLLISKEEQFKQEMKDALLNASRSDSEDSGLQNIDLYFQQYNNPTSKSLPFEAEPELSSQNIDGDSETIGTIYRNHPIDVDEEGDRDLNPDDKSTVILAALKNVQKKDKTEEPVFLPTTSIPNYSSLQNDPQPSKKEGLPIKIKKSNSKNATTSMPSEVHSREHYKSQNHLTKNSSISKKIESPVMGLAKRKQAQFESEEQASRDGRGKLAKVSKIDREQLTKLQEKKTYKKSELSSNRKKTKRGLGTVKSSSNVARHSKMAISSTNYTSQKSYGNTSCKKLQNPKKDGSKKQEKHLLNHQDWNRMQKTSKKLNRVNICKLQQNMKKAYEKKPTRDPSANRVEKKSKKTGKLESYHKEHHELKLHFTDGDDETAMKKLIEEKELDREYTRQTNKYLEVASKMSRHYFEVLMKECRETSEEAVLRIKLVTLVIYFFDQFIETCLLSNQKFNPKNEQFFTKIAEEEIIEVLLHPKKIMKVIQNLPNILMKDNIMSAERIQIFLSKFSEVNEQLDQELEFFLIKKQILYTFIHVLSEYISFLIQKDLIAQTKRSKVLPITSKEPLHGFYSGRSKRQEAAHKYLKKNETGNKIGLRCDSDRKITLEDQDFCFKEISKGSKKEPNHKSSQLKKLFK